jgi:CRP-like cAMP-binding protein
VIESRCQWSRFKAGEDIIDRDSENRDVYLVVEGRVRIVNFSSTGREIAYANTAAGGYFGELAAIDGNRRSAAVVAVEDCLLAALSPGVFLKLLVKHPSVSMKVLQRLTNIVRTSNDRIMDLSTLKAVERVCRELLRLTKPDAAVAELRVIRPMLSHNEIASRASTTRETVARVIGQLSTRGIVERKHKALYIRSVERLERLAGSGGEDTSDP